MQQISLTDRHLQTKVTRQERIYENNSKLKNVQNKITQLRNCQNSAKLRNKREEINRTKKTQ